MYYVQYWREAQMTENQNKSATIVSVVAILALVILNIYSDEVPQSVNFGLIGAALGASIEDIRGWLGGKK